MTQTTSTTDIHMYRWHPTGVTDQVAGTSNSGSASCSCGGWTANVLDNRAGAESARAGHREHLVEARRARIAAIVDRLDNLDRWALSRDLQQTIEEAVADLRAANYI